jgi:hypothetical protein
LEDLNMKSLKIASIALALAFAVGMGCGDDSTTSNPDAPVITGTGGTMGPDAGIPGTGGMMTPDAPLATGGTMTPDAPLGAGGMMAPDGAAVGTGGMAVDGPMGAGGMVQIDATMGTGGMGGGIDASMPGTGGSVSMDGGGEVGVATNICTGLSAAACDQAIRNAPVPDTTSAQTPPATNPPAYSACSL